MLIPAPEFAATQQFKTPTNLVTMILLPTISAALSESQQSLDDLSLPDQDFPYRETCGKFGHESAPLMAKCC
jgi:hypothetical protein